MRITVSRFVALRFCANSCASVIPCTGGGELYVGVFEGVIFFYSWLRAEDVIV